MLLNSPERSNGRTVSFCAVGNAVRAVHPALWHCAVSAVSVESVVLCVCIQQTMCRIAGFVFFHFQRQNMKRLLRCGVTSLPNNSVS